MNQEEWKYKYCAICMKSAKTCMIYYTPSFPNKFATQYNYFCEKHHPIKIKKQKYPLKQ